VVAIEIVSNREGGEDREKFQKHAAAGYWFSLVFSNIIKYQFIDRLVCTRLSQCYAPDNP
jgi:hypothetical protein